MRQLKDLRRWGAVVHQLLLSRLCWSGSRFIYPI
jgi:hypothetical protein